jgi:hypothetical protein
MTDRQRRKALKVIKRYMRNSFYESLTVSEYIEAVRARLLAFGIKSPKDPIQFVTFCKSNRLF